MAPFLASLLLLRLLLSCLAGLSKTFLQGIQTSEAGIGRLVPRRLGAPSPSLDRAAAPYLSSFVAILLNLRGRKGRRALSA